MKPVKFAEANATFGEGQPQYEPLPALLFPDGQVITCWELTEEEKATVAKTGQIWLSQLTFNRPLQPIALGVEKEGFIIPVEGAGKVETQKDGR